MPDHPSILHNLPQVLLLTRLSMRPCHLCSQNGIIQSVFLPSVLQLMFILHRPDGHKHEYFARRHAICGIHGWHVWCAHHPFRPLLIRLIHEGVVPSFASAIGGFGANPTFADAAWEGNTDGARMPTMDYAWAGPAHQNRPTMPMDLSLPEVQLNPDVWSQFLQDFEVPGGFFLSGHPMDFTQLYGSEGAENGSHYQQDERAS
jgi:hypothetical protein